MCILCRRHLISLQISSHTQREQDLLSLLSLPNSYVGPNKPREPRNAGGGQKAVLKVRAEF